MKKLKNNPDLIIFDFDNVMYRHSQACFQRMLLTAAVTAFSCTGRPLGEMKERCKESWLEKRDGFYFLKDELGADKYHEVHRQFARVVRDDVHGVPYPEIANLVDKLSDKTQVCFMSHSITKTLHMMMTRLEFDSTMISHHAYGMNCLGGGDGWARKDDPESGVYEWICNKYGVDPHNAVMVEDSEINLLGAKKAGLGTVHINGGNDFRYGKHIDMTFQHTPHFIKYMLDYGVLAKPQQKLCCI